MPFGVALAQTGAGAGEGGFSFPGLGPADPGSAPITDAEGNIIDATAPGGFITTQPGDLGFGGITPEEGAGFGPGAGGGAAQMSMEADAATSDPSTNPLDDLTTIQRLVLEFVLSSFGWLMSQAGVLMDAAIYNFVFRYAELYRSNFGTAVETTWEVIRDLMNMAFVFGLVYIGFRFIFNGDDTSAKRNLVLLIIAALLVNFSLFFAKAIIDVTNAAAFQFASSVNIGGTNARNNASFSGAFIAATGVNSVLDNRDILAGIVDPNNNWVAWGYIFMMAMVLLIAAFVFVAVAIILVIRFIALTFLLVFSPIMFLGFIFPFFKSLSWAWFSKFLSQAALAPAMILMLYISLIILNNLQGALMSNAQGRRIGGILSPGDATVGNISGLDMFTLFILGGGFMVGSLIVAMKLGSTFAGGAVAVLDKTQQGARRWATRAPIRVGAGGAAWVGQQTVGRAGSHLTRSDTLRRWEGASGWRGVVGRAGMSTAQTAAEASYDARNVGGVGKKLGVGAGSKKSYAQRQRDINKKELERAKRYASGVDTQLFEDNDVSDLYQQHQEMLQDRDRVIATLTRTTNAERRRELTQQINDIERDINQFENNQLVRPDDLTDGEWQQQVQRLQRYNAVRTNMRTTLQNRYAATLAQRGEGLPGGLRQTYNLFWRSREENETAAAAIRRDAGRGPNDRLLDAIRDIRPADNTT